MTRWFARLRIHQKLMTMALFVTMAALTLATVGLAVRDLWRYRAAALDDAHAVAAVIAGNTSASVRFNERGDAETILRTAMRPEVRRTCLYLTDGSLFAEAVRSGPLRCPATQPAASPWNVIAGTALVTNNDRTLGTIYLERDLTELRPRLREAALTGGGMLLFAGVLALVLADRLHKSVSAPIVALAAAARRLGTSGTANAFPDVKAGEDEIGDLVRAFSEMVRRVHDANAELTEANDRLRQREAERERLLAREREASRLKDEFLAAVSHELRTPLNAIVGWVQILSTTTANPAVNAKAIASITRNVRAQTRVIEDLVDVSRIVTGKLTLKRETVDLREVAQSAMDVTRPAAEARRITLSSALPGEPCLVDGDRDRLQQIVWNLLSNAVKFTAEGGSVSLALTREGDSLVVTVADTGIGIEPDFLPHVFDRFRQADGSTTRSYGGLGLGLAIVKELTELHGGEVSAASAGAEAGAVFTVRLPQMGERAAPAPEPAPAPRTTGALSGIDVLVVDDNADARDVLAAELGLSGACVRVTSNGPECIREWERRPPDVILCDVAMPDMDGFEVLQAIRERDRQAGRRTPAVALTAYVSDAYRARTREAGFDAHVSKPYDIDDLAHRIAAVVERT